MIRLVPPSVCSAWVVYIAVGCVLLQVLTIFIIAEAQSHHQHHHLCVLQIVMHWSICTTQPMDLRNGRFNGTLQRRTLTRVPRGEVFCAQRRTYLRHRMNHTLLP